ncbi:hypothetical protein [Brumimicrobium aurantiacum]|nr:hypothetical protein [Brumimicrobium aurantiacum]
MKLLFFMIILFWINIGYSQSYMPFNEDTPKRFMSETDSADNDYYFYSTETFFNGDTILFNQYFRESFYHVNVSGTYCEMWGGGFQPTADTTWLGRHITYNTLTNELKLKNNLNEILSFNFGLNIGDSALFYNNNSIQYYLKYEQLNQELVVDTMDWVKTYTITKYDALENLLQSPLSGFEIKLSERFGLVNFIDCNSFPSVEKGFVLMGQQDPMIGHYQLTYDEVFPWVPGDTLELYGIYDAQNYGVRTVKYDLITIQDRIETSDSVKIYLNIDTQIDYLPNGAPIRYPSAYGISYPNPIVFEKGRSISRFPHKAVFNRTTYLNDSAVNCGNRGRVTIYNEFLEYCDSCDCFTPYDGDGSGKGTVVYQEGLGIVKQTSQGYGDFDNFKMGELIYSNVGGARCGSYEPLSVDEYQINATKKLVKVVDILGREVKIQPNTLQIYIYSDGSSEKKFVSVE